MTQDEYEKLCARAKVLIEQVRAFPAHEMMAHEDKNPCLRDSGLGTIMWLGSTPSSPKREMRTTRRPLECEPCRDKDWVRYPVPGSLEHFYSKPGELFEQITEVADGKAITRSIIRVVDGKDIVLWQNGYPIDSPYPFDD